MATEIRSRRSVGGVSLAAPPTVLALNGAAVAAVLFHVFIDFHIGLFGPSATEMSAAQAANAVRLSVNAGVWLVALGVAMRGSRTGAAAALAIVVVWAVLFNGLAAFVFAPPPSDAFPYQDISHSASLVFGTLAALSLRDHLAGLDGRVDRRWLGLVLLWLLVIAPVLGVFATPVVS